MNDLSSSDHFVDIQISESLGKESLMSIDSSNIKDDFVSIAGFFILLAISVLTGYYGPPKYSSRSYEHYFSTGSVEKCPFSLSKLSNLNRHLSIDIYFSVKNDFSIENQSVNIDYKFACSKKSSTTMANTGSKMDVRLRSQPKTNFSNTVHIFTDHLLNYDYIEGEVLVLGYEGIKSAIVQVTYGNRINTIYELYIRTAFFLISSVFFVSFFLRLRKSNMSQWHIEQLFTLLLAFLQLLYNNPFFYLFIKFPSYISILFMIIINCSLKSFLAVYPVLVFDLFRTKNMKTNSLFFKVSFFIMCFVAFFSRETYFVFNSLNIKSYDSKLESIFLQIEIFIHSISLFWTIMKVFNSMKYVDSTDLYKFKLYTLTIVPFYCMHCLCFVSSSLEWLSNSSLVFMLSISPQNIIAMISIYFHWPYEVLNDQEYMDPSQSTNTNDFFLKEK